MKDIEQNLKQGFASITAMAKIYVGASEEMEAELKEIEQNVLNNDIKSEIEWQMKK